MPPSENPSTSHFLIPRPSRKAKAWLAIPATGVGTEPADLPIPALSNKIISLPRASGSVTAASQLSRVPVKCCRHRRGRPEPAPKRRYAYRVSFTSINCVGAVMLLEEFLADILQLSYLRIGLNFLSMTTYLYPD